MLGRPLGTAIFRFAIVLLLVLAAFWLRLWLEEWCPPNRFTVSIFYMVVVLASYFLGAVEAAVAAVLSALVAYWAFVTPTFAWKWDPVEAISMGSFGLTSAVDIYFITAMKKAVHRYRMERQRFEMLAEGNAALFHDYNERTANYLNLLSITLKRSTESPSGVDMQLIDDAWRQAHTLSSLHRGQSGEGHATTELLPFAKQLLENLARAAGLRRATVSTAGSDEAIPADRAALMAILVAEWTHLALPYFDRSSDLAFDVTFHAMGDTQRLSLTLEGNGQGAVASSVPVSPTRIVDIITAHMGGRLQVVQSQGRLSFDFVAPTKLPTDAPVPVVQRILPTVPPHMTVN
ncbi:MAG TPA: DUF4118 domain-containing protein [Sphingobium sp.]|uniref:DUF4118 domain-containing protein n=1 Tax=Sphingobium sp. TaxID=1912891 RepID=UPI002ED246F6